MAFGLLTQLCLEQRSAAFLTDMVAFYRAVGLPTSLNDLGFSGDIQQGIRTIAQRSVAEAPYLKQFVGTVTEDTLVAALTQADNLAKAR